MNIITVYWVFFSIFVLKLIGNLLLPYRVLKMSDEEGISIGLGLFIDWILFFLLLGFAHWSSQAIFIYRMKMSMFTYGGAILLTYLHYFIVLGFFEILRRRKSKK
jgi:hypothetical protein